MPAPSATVRQGDTLRLAATLTGADAAVQALGGATVVFSLRRAGGSTLAVNRAACDIVDAEAGRVQYVGAPGLEPGLYYGEFEVTLADDTVITFPNDGYAEITVTQEIA